MPGCESPWMASNTTRRQEGGTMGLSVPVEVSHNKVVAVPGIGRSASTNRVMAYTWAYNIKHGLL